MNIEKISKTMCYALRHNPKQFGLVLDNQGFCLIDDLLIGLINNNIKNINIETIYEIVKTDEKGRYEIIDNKIRTLYGHSIKEEIKKESCKPPNILYHGTTEHAFNEIIKSQLSHKQRQKVCLSTDIETARMVALRRTKNPFIIIVNARLAFENGINFYKEPGDIWLSDDIPCNYLELLKDGV